MSKLAGIYALIDPCVAEPLETLAAAVRGGVRLFQYRDKRGTDIALVQHMNAIASAADAVLILNDDPIGCSIAGGVHLGQEDLASVDLVSLRAMHPQAIIGISCPDVATAIAALRVGADYVGVGAMYATDSKSDAGAPIGPQGVRAVVDAVRVPVAAIGGITLARLPEVRSTGASMAAMLGAISGAPSAEAAARAFVGAWATQAERA